MSTPQRPQRPEEFDSVERPESFAYQDARDISAWQPYTASAVHYRFNGATTLTAQYYVIGRTCHAQIKVDPGTSLTSYQDSSFVTLPISSYGYSGMANVYTVGANLVSYDAGVVVSTAVVRIGDANAIPVPLYVYAIYQI